ncbi:MAG TPA: hypothetical protein VEC38_11500 [Candidatus Binataceae bacterium]|nr:hypothetical protein [Candidatus Binataceae bacterium]
MHVPLTPEAVRALATALEDKNSEVRSFAASSLHNAGGAAEQAARAEEKREKEAEEAANPKAPTPPPAPAYSEEQIIAPIPADANHKHPLTLALFEPIQGYAVTLHVGKDRPERLVFWKITDDKYQKIVLMESDLDSDEHFQVPIGFQSIMEPSGEWESFVDVATVGRHGVTDRVLHIDNEEHQWQPVEIESPEDWYKDKLAPSEAIRHAGRNFFSDGGLEFAFLIWNANDPECCPTAGEVTGTYKIVRAQPSVVEAPGLFSAGRSIVVVGNKVAQTQTSQLKAAAVPRAGTGIAGAGNKVVQIQPRHVGARVGSHGGGAFGGWVYNEPNSVATWKMVVDTAKRQPTLAGANAVQEILR